MAVPSQKWLAKQILDNPAWTPDQLAAHIRGNWIVMDSPLKELLPCPSCPGYLTRMSTGGWGHSAIGGLEPVCRATLTVEQAQMPVIRVGEYQEREGR